MDEYKSVPAPQHPDPYRGYRGYGGQTPDGGGYPPYDSYTSAQNAPVPYAYQAQPAPSQGGGALSKLPIKEIQHAIERMGGIDGITNAVAKVQKLAAAVQSMSPMVKLLLGSFGKAAAKNGGAGKRRRRRRRRNRAYRRRTRTRSQAAVYRGGQGRPRRRRD